jgi:hypothetical protein
MDIVTYNSNSSYQTLTLLPPCLASVNFLGSVQFAHVVAMAKELKVYLLAIVIFIPEQWGPNLSFNSGS